MFVDYARRVRKARSAGLKLIWDANREDLYEHTGEQFLRRRVPTVEHPDRLRVIEFSGPKGRPGWYAIIHRATKAVGEWQLSWFDEDGAVGDTRRADVNELIRVALIDGYAIKGAVWYR